jgi:hypothetical protein
LKLLYRAYVTDALSGGRMEEHKVMNAALHFIDVCKRILFLLVLDTLPFHHVLCTLLMS